MLSEGITLAFTNTASNRRRIRLERRDAGGWVCVEEEFSQGHWRPCGREIVADVELEVGAGTTDVLDVIGATGQSVTGPEETGR